VQRADTTIANRIARDVEIPAEILRRLAVDDVFQGLLAQIADGPVEKARAHGTVGFHNGRNPRSVADRRFALSQAQLSAKMAGNAAQFFRRLADEARFPFSRRLVNQQLDLRFLIL
jgi:hypothetical protein